MTGPVHQLHSPELREPVLSGSLGASRDSVGAPILFARNELRGDVNGPPGEGELLGDVCGKRGTAVPVVVQRPVVTTPGYVIPPPRLRIRRAAPSLYVPPSVVVPQ